MVDYGVCLSGLNGRKGDADSGSEPETGARKRGMVLKPCDFDVASASESANPPRGDPLEGSGASAQTRGDPLSSPGTPVDRPWKTS